jgi:hypothetical protein
MKIHLLYKPMWGISLSRLCRRIYFFPIPLFGLCVELAQAPSDEEVEDFHNNLCKLEKSFLKLAADSEELGAIRAALKVDFGPNSKYGVTVQEDSTSRMTFNAVSKLVHRLKERSEGDASAGSAIPSGA